MTLRKLLLPDAIFISFRWMYLELKKGVDTVL